MQNTRDHTRNLQEYSIDAVGNTRRKLPGYKRPEKQTILDGYTGYIPKPDNADNWEDDTLYKRNKKIVIRGYTGFIPNKKYVLGKPEIPSLAEQTRYKGRDPDAENGEDDRSAGTSTNNEGSYSKYRVASKQMVRNTTLNIPITIKNANIIFDLNKGYC